LFRSRESSDEPILPLVVAQTRPAPAKILQKNPIYFDSGTGATRLKIKVAVTLWLLASEGQILPTEPFGGLVGNLPVDDDRFTFRKSNIIPLKFLALRGPA
jgi:hypothetical protein